MDEVLQQLAQDGPLAVLFGYVLFRIEKAILGLAGEVHELRGELRDVCRQKEPTP